MPEALDTEAKVPVISPDTPVGAGTYPTGRRILDFCPSLRYIAILLYH